MNDRRDSTQPNIRAVRPSASAPPKFLFWWVVGLFLIVVIASIVAFLIYRSQGRLVSLIQPLLITLLIAAVYTWLLSIIFRDGLPRRFSLWLLVAYAVIAVGGLFAGVNLYQNNVPPRYQAELITPFPFLSGFLPPTPIGGALPTVASTAGGRSAQDLLLGLGGSPTTQPTIAATATRVPPTSTPNDSPTPLPASATLAATATPIPTATTAPTQVAVVPSAAPNPGIAVASAALSSFTLPPSHFNGGFRTVRQGWNNCGPANIVQALSYYGWQGTQEEAAAFLKPDPEDKNVTPSEMVRFVNTQTAVRALTRIGGTEELLKAFIAGGFPVIVEVGGALYEGENWIGHYRTIVGYDDSAAAFLVYDTWLGNGGGNGIAVPYTEMDETWKPFNRVFVVVYEPQRESQVIDILGERADLARANELALETARQEALADPTDGFAWYNIGTALTRLGRYDEASLAFDEATRFRLPFRMAWYQFYNFEAFFNAERYSDVLSLVNINLNNGGFNIEETYYWQGRVLQVQGDIAGARGAFERALVHNYRYTAAQEALDALPG
jgi:hypothetical protein